MKKCSLKVLTIINRSVWWQQLLGGCGSFKNRRTHRRADLPPSANASHGLWRLWIRICGFTGSIEPFPDKPSWSSGETTAGGWTRRPGDPGSCWSSGRSQSRCCCRKAPKLRLRASGRLCGPMDGRGPTPGPLWGHQDHCEDIRTTVRTSGPLRGHQRLTWTESQHRRHVRPSEYQYQNQNTPRSRSTSPEQLGAAVMFSGSCGAEQGRPRMVLVPGPLTGSDLVQVLMGSISESLTLMCEEKEFWR